MLNIANNTLMLSAVMLSAIMLNVIMLSVFAPRKMASVRKKKKIKETYF
jgi:hypothetical protein